MVMVPDDGRSCSHMLDCFGLRKFVDVGNKAFGVEEDDHTGKQPKSGGLGRNMAAAVAVFVDDEHTELDWRNNSLLGLRTLFVVAAALLPLVGIDVTVESNWDELVWAELVVFESELG